MTTTEQILEEIKTMQAKLDALMAARARTEARTDMAYYASLPPDERKKALKARKQ